MATSNFGYDDVLGIIALNTIDFEKEAIEDYNENVATCDDEMIDSLSDDDWYYFYEDWKNEIDELNGRMSTLYIELESGYYEGAMLRLHYGCSKVLSSSSYCTDEELASIINNRYDKKQLTKVCRDIDCYYWSISPSEIFNDYDVLKEWINNNLKCKALLNLGIAYRFDNGETGYSISNELL